MSGESMKRMAVFFVCPFLVFGCATRHSGPPTRKIPISGDVVRVDVMLRVINEPNAIVTQTIVDRAKLNALISFFRDWSRWMVYTEKKKEDYPAGEKYLDWIVFLKADGSKEIIGLKETAMYRDGYWSPLSATEVKKIDDLTEMQFVPGFDLD